MKRPDISDYKDGHLPSVTLYLDDLEKYITDIESENCRMQEALEIHEAHNNIRNDVEVYLHDIIQWALLFEPKPDPKDYGL